MLGKNLTIIDLINKSMAELTNGSKYIKCYELDHEEVFA
jgi:hypothetical protein